MNRLTKRNSSMKIKSSQHLWQKLSFLCLAGVAFSFCFLSANPAQAAEKTITVSVGKHPDVGVGYGWLRGDGHKLKIVLQATTGSSTTMGWKIKKSSVMDGSGASLWHVPGISNQKSNDTPADTHTYEGVGLSNSLEVELLADEDHSVRFHGELLKTGGSGTTIPEFDLAVAQVDIKATGVDDNKETSEEVSANTSSGMTLGSGKEKITVKVTCLKPGKTTVKPTGGVKICKTENGTYVDSTSLEFPTGVGTHEVWVQAAANQVGNVEATFLATKNDSKVAIDKLGVNFVANSSQLYVGDLLIFEGDTTQHDMVCKIKNTSTSSTPINYTWTLAKEGTAGPTLTFTPATGSISTVANGWTDIPGVKVKVVSGNGVATVSLSEGGANDWGTVTVVDANDLKIEITEVKGLFKTDGTYQIGYKSDDKKGRIYSNRIYNSSDPNKTTWTKNKQYVDITVKVKPEGLLLPANTQIAWTVEDPDDPSNEDTSVSTAAKKILDPNDYNSTDDDSDGTTDNSDGNDNSGSRDGASQWEQIHANYTLTTNQTKIKDGTSKIRFNATDDGGDNFIVRAKITLNLNASAASAEDETGIMTTWKKINVEYVKMKSATDLTALANKSANAYLEKAFVELRPEKRIVNDFKNSPGKKQMGANNNIAYTETENYATKNLGEFKHEKDPGWFFAAAANWYIKRPNTTSAPIFYSGPAKIVGPLEFELPVGKALSNSDKRVIDIKTADSPAVGGNYVMKTNHAFTIAKEMEDASIYGYDLVKKKFLEGGTVVAHTVGAVGGDSITYQASAAIPNGPFVMYKTNVSSVRVKSVTDPTKYKSFLYDSFSWDPLTRRFKVNPAEYSSPKVSDTLSFNLIDHGWVAGSSPNTEVRGTGAFATAGLSPGRDHGKTFVFTKEFNAADIAAGEHINTLIHEFGHSLGFYHICGNWDYKSQNTSGKACTMHYDWFWMHDGMLNDPPPVAGVLKLLPFSSGHGGPHFCAPHLRAIREVNLENRTVLGW